MAAEQTEIDQLIAQNYVPSALERKKSILMYFLRGIVISITQGKMTRYEFFHCKQAMGWRVLFFLLLVPSIVLVFLPYLRVLPRLIYLALVIVRAILVKQAREGKFTSFKSDKVFLPLFEGLGGWMVDLFSLEIEITDASVHTNESSSSTTLS
ncbi:hypothetical protein KBC03_03320 [Patescibacteria group bacterium]|nr:hypothetical protein [Patescibacteria group bacterium]